MSIRLSQYGNRLLRASGTLVSSLQNFTARGFAKLSTAPVGSDYAYIFYVQGAGGSSNIALYIDSSGNFKGNINYGGGDTGTIGTMVAGGASGENWYYFAVTSNGSGAGSLNVYFMPVGGASLSSAALAYSSSSNTVDVMSLGSAFPDGTFGSRSFNGWLAGVRLTNGVLTPAQLLADARQLPPSVTTNLLSSHEFQGSDLTAALQPNQGTGAWVVQEVAPTMSSDNPVLIVGPTLTGLDTLPLGEVSALLTGNWTMPTTRPADSDSVLTVGDHSNMSVTEASASITYPITVVRQGGGSQTFTLTQTVTKAKAGAAAKTLTLSASAQAFTYDATDAPSPASQTITFTANLQNLEGPAVFSGTRYDITGAALGPLTLSGAGNTRTLTATDFGANTDRAVITASYEGYSDTITVVSLEDGVNGQAPNLLSNSNFKNGSGGWFIGFNTGTNVVTGLASFTAGFNGSWNIAGADTAFLQENGTRPGNGVTDGVIAADGSKVPVISGERLDVSCYYQAHRCTGSLRVSFFDAANNYLGELEAAPLTTHQGVNGRTLDQYQRGMGFVTVPTYSNGTVALAQVFARKGGTAAGQSDSFFFATMFFIGRATATQQTNSPWSDGALRHVDTPDLMPSSVTAVFEGSAAGAALDQFSTSVSGLAQITVPSYRFPISVRCTASVSGTVTYRSGFLSLPEQSIAAGIWTAGKRPLVQETMATCSANAPVMSGSCTPTATFDVPLVNGETGSFPVSVTIVRNNSSASGLEAASYGFVRLAVEIIKR